MSSCRRRSKPSRMPDGGGLSGAHAHARASLGRRTGRAPRNPWRVHANHKRNGALEVPGRSPGAGPGRRSRVRATTHAARPGGKSARARIGATRALSQAGTLQFGGHGSSCAGLSTLQQQPSSAARSRESSSGDSPAQHDASASLASCVARGADSSGSTQQASSPKPQVQPHNGNATPDGRIHPGSIHARSNQRASMAIGGALAPRGSILRRRRPTRHAAGLHRTRVPEGSWWTSGADAALQSSRSPARAARVAHQTRRAATSYAPVAHAMRANWRSCRRVSEARAAMAPMPHHSMSLCVSKA